MVIENQLKCWLQLNWTGKYLPVAALLLFLAAPSAAQDNYRTLFNVETGFSVQISHKAVNNMTFLYHKHKRELALCLFGRRWGESYRIEDVGMPFYLENDEDSTEFNPAACKRRPDFLGIAHNHPKAPARPAKATITALWRTGTAWLRWCSAIRRAK